MGKLTKRQYKIMSAIASGRNGQKSADGIAAAMGYRPARSGRLAVSSSLKTLQKAALVGRIPPIDQWDHATYFLLDAGDAALNLKDL